MGRVINNSIVPSLLSSDINLIDRAGTKKRRINLMMLNKVRRSGVLLKKRVDENCQPAISRKRVITT